MDLVNTKISHRGYIKPCDLFDLIGGTSTGGLIAIMLGRLEMDVDECIEAYRALMESVFSDKTRKIALDWSGNVKAQYDSQKLRAAIEHVIVSAGVSPDAVMNDGNSRRCRVFVCTTSKETLEVTRLRSYDSLDENTPSPTICEAALATSAATKFFDPVSIGDRQFVDGAFGANNPVEEVEEEACDIWCSSKRNLQDLVKCLISVGTGVAGNQSLDDNILRFLSKTLVRMATKPAGVERRFMARWRRQCEENRCFRFNVDRAMEDVHMTDYQKRSLIETATHDYLHLPSQKSAVDHCTLNLAGKRGKTNVEFKDLVETYKCRAMQVRIETEINESSHLGSAPKPASWVVPFDRNDHYVDGDIMSHVSDQLLHQSSASKLAIYGLGGVGKTQIALELAYRAQESDSDCSVFWVPAMSPESIHQAYLGICDHLGLAVVSQEKNEILQTVHEYFSHQKSGRWLLIFDNADDIEMWGRFSEPGARTNFQQFVPASSLGRILFTTRSTKVALTLAPSKMIHIPEMDYSRARRMMNNLLVRQGNLGDDVKTRDLLERLTYLPLAIAQAAAFINQNGTSITEYIALMDGQEQDAILLLSEDFEDKGRYKSIRNPVATTWLTSFDQILRESPSSFNIMATMACLNSRDIPISLLPDLDKIEEKKALGLLEAYSLIRYQPNRQRLDLHRLVHLAMRNHLRVQGTLQHFEQWVLGVLAYKFPSSATTNQSLWREYSPHAFHILDLTSSYRLSKDRAYLQWKMMNCFIMDGRFTDGIALARKVIKFREEKFGPEDEETLRALSALTTLYGGQGLRKEAAELEHQVLQRKLRVCGPDSFDVCFSLGTLCDIHLSLGNLRIAEWLGASALKSLLKQDALESREARLITGMMTEVYLREGRLKNAIRLAEQLLSVTTRVCGAEDRDTFSVHLSILTINVEQGLYEKAAVLGTELLTKAEALFGLDHPTTTSYMQLLLNIFGRQGRNLEAATLAIKLAHIFERRYGPEHKFVKESYDSAHFYKNMKTLSDRTTEPLSYTWKPRKVLERRRLNPRVRLYGGLYCPRRQLNDESLIILIERANQLCINRAASQSSSTSSEACSVEKLKSDRADPFISDMFSYPSYVSKSSARPEPKFCFGGGLFT
ncbi:Acyl transferase/acyl hydrolase/lysophospholipase [Penicillium malachiteum]|nr:Acyl transferase/acyl hydrolase/lysophospholipase [Penicillium malachiteum]